MGKQKGKSKTCHLFKVAGNSKVSKAKNRNKAKPVTSNLVDLKQEKYKISASDTEKLDERLQEINAASSLQQLASEAVRGEAGGKDKRANTAAPQLPRKNKSSRGPNSGSIDATSREITSNMVLLTLSRRVYGCSSAVYQHSMPQWRCPSRVPISPHCTIKRMASVEQSSQTEQQQPPSVGGLWTQRLRLFCLGRRFTRNHLQATAQKLYANCTDPDNQEAIYGMLKLPNTFYSWYMVTVIHVWIVMGCLMQDTRDGKQIRNRLVQGMWQEIAKRIKIIAADEESKTLKKNLGVLHTTCMTSLMALDGGLLARDIDLASALFKHFDVKNVKHLEFLVGYIRAQANHVNSLGLGHLLVYGEVHWLPIDKEKH